MLENIKTKTLCDIFIIIIMTLFILPIPLMVITYQWLNPMITVFSLWLSALGIGVGGVLYLVKNRDYD